VDQIKRLQTNARLSQAVIHGQGSTVHVAGQVASDRQQDVTGQTRQVLQRVDALLSECGTNRKSILSAMVWLADIQDFDAMNEVWDAWIPPGCAPARACVESRLAKPDIKVEIQVIAAA